MVKLQVCYFQGQLVNCDTSNDLWARSIVVIFISTYLFSYSEIIPHRKVAKPWKWALASCPHVLIFYPAHYSLVPFSPSLLLCIDNFLSYLRIESNMMALHSSDTLSASPKAEAIIYTIIVQWGEAWNQNHRYYSCFVSYTVSIYKKKYRNKICPRF